MNIRGDVGQFAHMSPAGDVNTQVAYRQHKPFPPIYLSGGTDSVDNLPSPGILISTDPNNQGPTYIGGIGPDIATINVRFPGDHTGHPLFPGQHWVDPVQNANLITLAGTKNDIVYISGWLSQPTDIPIVTPPPAQQLPPILISSVPINNQTGITNLTLLSGLFSQNVDPTTINNTNIRLSPPVPVLTSSLDTLNPARVNTKLNPVISFLAAGSTYIDATNNALLKVGQTALSQASYSAWFRIRSAPAAKAGIMSMGSVAMQPYVDTDGTLKCDFDYNTHATYFAVTGVSVVDGKWHHVVLTNDSADTSQIFLDGSLLIDTFNSDYLAPSGTAHLFIGAVYASNFWDNGEIAEVRVYNVQLAPSEVTTLFNLGNVTRGMVAHWDMREGSGTTITDSVNSIVGTLTNSPQWIPSSLTRSTVYTLTYGTGLASLVGGFTNTGNQTVTFTTQS